MNDTTISRREWNKLMSEIATLKKAIIKEDISDYISESEAAAILDCSIRTLQNKVYNGTMSQESYVVGELGKRFYKRSRLMGIKKTA